LDSYGDNYRLYRDSIAASRRGFDVYSTSAHNIFIDLAATGGVFLLLAFVIFTLYVTAAGFTELKKSGFKNFETTTLVALWIGFLAQLIISINVSSVSIWGFFVAGLIVRTRVNSKDSAVIVNKTSKRSSVSKNRQSQRIKFIVAPLFMVIVFPLLLRDIQLADAISNSSKDKLISATTSWPQSCFYLAKTEEALSQVEDFTNSLSVSKESVRLNSKCFDSWRHIFENPTATELEKSEAQKKILKLDPNLKPD
jgi:hypothetical protein